MTKKTRLALGLLLCLLLCVCLLPAAYADSAGAETFAALKTAIANGETYFNMIDCGTVVFTEDITLPSNLHLEAYGTSVIIPEGVTLTVDGTAQFSHVTVQHGGHVTVNRYFGAYNMLDYESVDQFTVNGEFEVFEDSWTDDLVNLRLGEKADFELGITASNDSALAAAIARDYHFPSKQFTKNITVEFPWVLNQDYDIRDIHIDIGSKGSLTIPEGITLTISDVLRAQGAPIYLQGTLINNGRFSIHRKDSTGALLIRSGNGSYSGGDIRVYADADKCDACLEGFEKILCKKEVGDWGVVYAVSNNLFWVLKNAIANGVSDFNMRDCGTVRFAESITIPSTTKVHASGTEIVIPDGVTLTVESYNRIGTLTVEPGGHVTVSDVSGANLRVDDALNYNNINQFTINRNMEISPHSWRDEMKNLNIGEHGKLSISSWAYNDSELADALASKPKLPSDKFKNRIGIRYNWTLADDMIVDDFNLAIEVPGSLTIPAGKTMTFFNKVEAQDAPIYVQGRMIGLGRGQLELQWEESAGALLNISGTGLYVGKEIHVQGPKDRRDACISGLDMSKLGKIINPDFSAYYLPVEAVLPENLTALEAEAFADSSFHTVYIPASVTSIAPDAFSGSEVLIINGVTGSFAEEYANSIGIPFMFLPPWYDVHNPQFVIVHE